MYTKSKWLPVKKVTKLLGKISHPTHVSRTQINLIKLGETVHLRKINGVGGDDTVPGVFITAYESKLTDEATQLIIYL